MYFGWFNSVCFPSLHMKPSPKSCSRRLKNTRDLPNRSSRALILPYRIMQERYSIASSYLSISKWIEVEAFCSWCVSYICKVTYQSNHFIDKNKDYIVAEHQALFTASNCKFVAGLFHALHEDSSRSSKFSSIGSRFKVLHVKLLVMHCKFWKEVYWYHLSMLQQQLHSLMESLNGTEPHYIRCIKPNNVLKPGIFENFNVIHQLRCGVRMSCLNLTGVSTSLIRPRIHFPVCINIKRLVR